MSMNEKKVFQKINQINREELYKKKNSIFKSWLNMEDYNNISNEEMIKKIEEQGLKPDNQELKDYGLEELIEK